MNDTKLVTKDNKLISASYSLGIPEQRLIFLAIIEARAQKQLIDAKGVLRIHASSYQEQFKVKKHTSYDALKSAASGLFEAHFEYDEVHKQTGKLARRVVRWVQEISYIDAAGMVELQFTNSVIPLITRLSNQYTEYELKQVSELQSEYSIRIYELAMQWKTVGKTNKILLKDLRLMLGVAPEQYKQMCNFKTRVLDHAVNQINEHTDILVKYEQHKTGRAITAISFTFKPKKTAKQITTVNESSFISMSDKQISMFSVKLAALPELGSNAPMGASIAEYATMIAADLADEERQKKYIKYLAKVGCQIKAA